MCQDPRVCEVTERYKMRYRNGFRDRLRFAWLRLQMRRQKDLIHEDLALEVTRIMGETVGTATISRWFRDRLPDAPTIGALADALEVDPGWLGFGEASKAPRPDDPIAGLYEALPDPDGD
jgi:transcriptional regulator with XRE-family HTH domain